MYHCTKIDVTKGIHIMISLISILTGLFVTLCFLLGLLILIQQGKGDMGLGGLGASSQMLFGGSGGQDFFEKLTWILGFIFMFSALGLSFLKSRAFFDSKITSRKSSRISSYQPEQVEEKSNESVEKEN
ncbi:preprotein translocase subunit SecG [Candidatus Dependentiae bacterium]|nr:MAG: preprotein translocase subunit SecG [Candidatus Dependentiae bacterium]